jgi:hypothetical protein
MQKLGRIHIGLILAGFPPAKEVLSPTGAAMPP